MHRDSQLIVKVDVEGFYIKKRNEDIILLSFPTSVFPGEDVCWGYGVGHWPLPFVSAPPPPPSSYPSYAALVCPGRAAAESPVLTKCLLP